MRTMVIVQPSRPGLLADVTTLLASHRIDLSDFSGHVVGDTAVITLQATPYRDGYRVLSEAGYHVYASETLLVRLDQEPGALARLSQRLAQAGVNVRGLHLVNKDERAGLVALETVDQDKAREVLREQLVG